MSQLMAGITGEATAVMQVARSARELAGVPPDVDFGDRDTLLIRGPGGFIYYVSADGLSYAAVGDLPGTISLDQLNAKGDGVTDDSALMTVACSGLWQKVRIRPSARHVIGNIRVANGVTIEGSAGRDYTSIHSYMTPKFIRKAGCYAVFDLNNQADANYGRAVTLRGIIIDGVDNTCAGISAGATRLNIDRVYITNCTNGIGGAAPGGSSYTRVLDATGLIITNCTVTGIRDLIDSRLNAPEIAACGIGIKATAGANHWQVNGGRVEWNTNENVRLDASGAGAPVSRVKFIGTEFDRGGAAGVFCNNVTDLQMVGCTHDRACALDTGVLGQRAQIHLENVSDVSITDGRFLHGKDDGGAGVDTPPYAIECNGVVTNLIWTGGSVSGGYLTAPIHYNSGLNTTQMPGHKITGVGGVEDYDNTSALNKANGRVYYWAGSTGVLTAAGGTQTLTGCTMPGPITFDVKHAALLAWTRNTTSGGRDLVAHFPVLCRRESSTPTLDVNTIPTEERGVKGAMAVGSGTLQSGATMQAGGTTTMAILSVGASGADDALVGATLTVTAGGNVGYSGVILGFNSTTKAVLVNKPANVAFGNTDIYTTRFGSQIQLGTANLVQDPVTNVVTFDLTATNISADPQRLWFELVPR